MNKYTRHASHTEVILTGLGTAYMDNDVFDQLTLKGATEFKLTSYMGSQFVAALIPDEKGYTKKHSVRKLAAAGVNEPSKVATWPESVLECRRSHMELKEKYARDPDRARKIPKGVLIDDEDWERLKDLHMEIKSPGRDQPRYVAVRTADGIRRLHRMIIENAVPINGDYLDCRRANFAATLPEITGEVLVGGGTVLLDANDVELFNLLGITTFAVVDGEVIAYRNKSWTPLGKLLSMMANAPLPTVGHYDEFTQTWDFRRGGQA